MALDTWPGGLQFGGGVTAGNAASYLTAGASHVIVTSYLFENDQLSPARLDNILRETGRQHLVLDLSCRRTDSGWHIATDRWQTVTDTPVDAGTLRELG